MAINHTSDDPDEWFRRKVKERAFNADYVLTENYLEKTIIAMDEFKVGDWVYDNNERKEKMSLRLVRVFVMVGKEINRVDDVEANVLHQTEEFWTDRTDEELKDTLSFEGMVDKHNQRLIANHPDLKRENVGQIRMEDLMFTVTTIVGTGHYRR